MGLFVPGPEATGEQVSIAEFLYQQTPEGQAAEPPSPPPAADFEWLTMLWRPSRSGYLVHGGGVTAWHRVDAEWVEVGQRYLLPARFHGFGRRPDGPLVALNLRTTPRGRVQCDGTLIVQTKSDRAVTGTAIRGIAFDHFIKTARDLVAVEIIRTPSGGIDQQRVQRRESSTLQTALAEFEEARHRSRRGVRLPDEHLNRVAAVYRAAQRNGEPTTRAVADELHTSRSNAQRWIAEARNRELIPKTPKKAEDDG
jgi:hypothetical protein